MPAWSRGSAASLALYDIFAKKVRAEVLDLNHGSQFVPHCPVDGGDDLAVTADSQVVVVTAGAKQKPGQTRLELAATNVAMAQELSPRSWSSCRPGGDRVRHQPRRRHHLRRREIGGPAAGRIRLRNGAGLQPVPLFDRRAGGPGRRQRARVHRRRARRLGDRCGQECVDRRCACRRFQSGGKLLFDKTQSKISHDVVNAAYEIIEGQGATNLAIGLSTARIIRPSAAISTVLPVSTLQTGIYGIEDVCLSLPTVVTAQGAGKVLEIPLSEPELAGLQASRRPLHDAWASVTKG